MQMVLDEHTGAETKNRFLILLGITTGLCIMSKVSGIFLWIGFGTYILFFERKLLGNPRLYIAAFLTLVISSPIFIWNSQNDFVNFAFHSNKDRHYVQSDLDTDSFLQQLIGSILYNNPVNFVIYCGTLLMIFRNPEWAQKSAGWRFLSMFKYSIDRGAVIYLPV